jgi:Protein of unknown function (DUF1566)
VAFIKVIILLANIYNSQNLTMTITNIKMLTCAASSALLTMSVYATAQTRSTGGSNMTPVTSIVSVTVTGMGSGDTIVVQNNGDATDNMTFSSAVNGASKSFKPIAGMNYSVKIISQPISSSNKCTIASPTGTATRNLTVAIVCGDGRFQAVAKPMGGTYPVTDCVKDMVTGTVWEGKPSSGTRAGSNGYSMLDDVNKPQKSSPQNNHPTATEIADISNGIGYRDAVKSSALCGFTDWKIPTLTQLTTLGAALDDIQFGAARVQMFFPNTQPLPAYYLTNEWAMGSPTHVNCFSHGQFGSFYCPRDGGKPQQKGAYLRLVR